MSEWHEGFVAGAVLVPLGVAVIVALAASAVIGVKLVRYHLNGFLFFLAVRTGAWVPFAVWRAIGFDTLFAGRLVLLRGEQWPRKPVGIFERIVRNYKGTRVFLFHCRRAYLDGVRGPWEIAEVGRRAATVIRL